MKETLASLFYTHQHQRNINMETLWSIWSILLLFCLQLVSIGQGLTVTINPNKNIFFLERGGKPKENITCESDCHASVKCTYKWYSIDGKLKKFTYGKILFRDKTIEESTTFQCFVEQSKNIYNWSHRIEIIINESRSPTRDTDVGIGLSGNNFEIISTEKEYGPRNVSIYSLSDLEDLWEGTGNITLTCRADCNPQCDRYQIYHDGQVLYNSSEASIAKDQKKSGKYSCGAYDIKLTRYIRSAEVDIDIKYGPSNVVMNSSSDLTDLWERTGNVTLTCRADCNPRCDRYQIYHDGQVLSYTKVTYITKDRKNSGKYSCGAYDIKSGRYVRSAEVDINIKYRTVYLSSNEKEMSLRVNRSLPSNVVCTIECNFQCGSDITLTKNSEQYKIIKSNGSIFSDRKALPSDRGVYRCKSGDSLSEDKIRLNILYGPRNTIISSFRKNWVKSEIVLTESPSESHRMKCLSSCNPRCNTKWYKNGEILNDEKNQSIDITVHRNQSGTYRCEAEGTEGKQSSDEVKFIVQFPPGSVEVKPSNTIFYSRHNGKPFTDITCEADCLPQCNYVWYEQKGTWSYLYYNYRYYGREYFFTRGSALFADRNHTNFHSRFRCSARNSIGWKRSTWKVVEVKDGPAAVKINAKGTTRENHPFELQCSAQCYHGCLSFTWLYKNKIYYGENLKFKNISRKDAGVYTCKVKDYFGTTSDKYTVNVQFGPSSVRIQYSSDGNLKENRHGWVSITCNSDCYPSCSFKFYQNGREIPVDVYYQKRNYILRRKIETNSGQYSCSAENAAIGRMNSSNFAVILILYKPRLSVSGIIPDIIAPGSLKLNFSIKSFPPSNVTVVHRGRILKYDTNVTGSKSYQIKITSCLDDGDYIVGAKNDVGSDEYRNRVTVKCSPMILKYSNISNKRYNIGDPLNLTTTFMANPAPDVSWSFTSYKTRNVSQKVEENLIHNKEMTSIIVDKLDVDNFGIYQLTLVNDIGNETMSFSIKGPPQPPTALTLDCISAAFLEWKPGFDGGTDQSFLIEYTTNLSSPWSTQSGLSITSKDNDRMSTYVTLINPNVRYFFRVISENVFGRVISDKIVNCTLQAVGGEESFLYLDTIAGISGGLVLILVAIVVLVLFGVKKYQNHHRKGQKARKQNTAQEEDCGMGMIENTLYISGNDVNTSTILSSNYPQNDAVNTKSRNDVYSVVKKIDKIEPDFPMYAEVCKSRPVKDKPAIKKKPAKKTKNSTGKTVNKDGLVYVEIDLKNTPALSGNSVIHGSDNKTLYVDIDFTRHADPLPECDVEDTNDANENKKKSHQE